MITKINVGPVHPSTSGLIRFVVYLEGDTIENLEVHIGFLHRGVEKLVENRMYMQSPPYMEKIDYVAPMAVDDAYVAAVEAALGIEVKERAKYIRLILLELQRIASHLLWLGTLCNDLGQFFTMFMWTFRDRDLVLRLLEEATGSRMFYVNMRLGGLNRDFPPGFEERANKVLGYLEKKIKEYMSILDRSSIFKERMKGVGILGREEAIELGVSGPVLRGSGVRFDVRSSLPYYAYKEVGFTPKVEYKGDNYSRYKVRMLEMLESIRIIRKAFSMMPEGDALGMPVKLITPNAKNKEVKVSRETPRGECMMYMIADQQRPYRLYMRNASYANLHAIEKIAKGHRFADLFAILGSLDPVVADVDK
ncbi:MAG: hypothetical protein QXL16_00695 [Candidatus Micrarchaeaceae archaeon]